MIVDTVFNLVGHSGNPISGVPHLRLRTSIGSYYAIQLGDGCEGEDPIITTEYDHLGNLTWSVSNANSAFLYYICNDIVYDPLTCELIHSNPGFVSEPEPIELFDGSASGYKEAINSHDRICPYFVIAENHCCRQGDGCGPPFCVMGSRINNIEGSDASDPSCYEYIVCWTVDYDQNDFGETGQTYLNGSPVDNSGTLTLPQHSNDTSQYYIITVTNSCGMETACSLQTHCCSRKEEAVITLSDFEDIDVDCTQSWNSTCFISSINCSSSVNGSRRYVFTANLSALNGTYIIPLGCDGVFTGSEYKPIVPAGEYCYGCDSLCRSKYVDTGLTVNITYEYTYDATMTRGFNCNWVGTHREYHKIRYQYSYKVWASTSTLFLYGGSLTYFAERIMLPWYLPTHAYESWSCSDSINVDPNSALILRLLPTFNSKCNETFISSNEYKLGGHGDVPDPPPFFYDRLIQASPSCSPGLSAPGLFGNIETASHCLGNAISRAGNSTCPGDSSIIVNNLPVFSFGNQFLIEANKIRTFTSNVRYQ